MAANIGYRSVSPGGRDGPAKLEKNREMTNVKATTVEVSDDSDMLGDAV
jgi:hypothetical protein